MLDNEFGRHGAVFRGKVRGNLLRGACSIGEI